MVKYKVSGDFNPLRDFLKQARTARIKALAEKAAKKGISILSAVTPVDTATTANSWDYEVVSTDDITTIYWKNTNVVSGIPVAVLIQYGHATKNGGYVEPIDFINPVLGPIFNEVAEKAWREVTGK